MARRALAGKSRAQQTELDEGPGDPNVIDETGVYSCNLDDLEPDTRAFYCSALVRLSEARLPFLVGGAFAFQCYTGIVRNTKDFDLFIRARDRDAIFAALNAAGWETEVTAPHWLGKAVCGEDFVDIIFSSGNGVAPIDEGWFEHALDGEVLGIPVKLCPPEEMIWSKSFVMERERYDGADVAHILRARAQSLDWQRLLERFGPRWRVLLSHLILFGFIYPAERSVIPAWVMRELIDRLSAELKTDAPVGRVCQGTVLSRAQYLVDLDQWGYQDGRIVPHGNMTPEETALWTAAIEGEKKTDGDHEGDAASGGDR